MKCLHISNDFSLTKVHKNLYSHLDTLGIEQIVFNPVKANTPVGNNNISFKQEKSKIIYSKKLKRWHKILFHNRIKFLFNDLDSNYDLKRIDLVHATTLYSDGAVAYQIYKKYKIPYIVAVRGTDLNLYMKYRPDLYRCFKRILQNASKIIFISNAIQNRFLDKITNDSTKFEIIEKSAVINNAIDSFWLNNISKNKSSNNPHKIIYVGRFDSNKNAVRLVEATLQLKSKFSNLEIHLVGKDGDQQDKIKAMAKTNKGTVFYHGPIYDKKTLMKQYLSNHIFAMPSYSETFGLVYIEALTQGLPILCSKNQGVYGTFKNKIGEFINPNSVDSIIKGLEKLLNNYNSYELNQINFNNFEWDSVAKKYIKLYKEII